MKEKERKKTEEEGRKMKGKQMERYKDEDKSLEIGSGI